MACQQSDRKNSNSNTVITDNKNNIAMVMYFHGKRRCPTCVAVGEITKSTLENYFKEEMQQGKIRFSDINIDDKQYENLVSEYQINWNALLILTNTKDGKKVEDLTELAFQHARTSPDELESAIKARLYIFLNQ